RWPRAGPARSRRRWPARGASGRRPPSTARTRRTPGGRPSARTNPRPPRWPHRPRRSLRRRQLEEFRSMPDPEEVLPERVQHAFGTEGEHRMGLDGGDDLPDPLRALLRVDLAAGPVVVVEPDVLGDAEDAQRGHQLGLSDLPHLGRGPPVLVPRALLTAARRH